MTKFDRQVPSEFHGKIQMNHIENQHNHSLDESDGTYNEADLRSKYFKTGQALFTI